MNKLRRAVVLLSGGLDSATVLYCAKDRGFDPKCLILDYGQRHAKEIRQAMKLARHTGSDYRLVKMPLPAENSKGGTRSALLDPSIPLPRNRKTIPKTIPVTYVPGRNMIFLSLAASFAEMIGAGAIFIGANVIDYSGYPDCRPEFYRAMQTAFRRGLKAGVEGEGIQIYTPLIRKTKAQIIRMGTKLGVPYHLTWSCYSGGKEPCGTCDSCLLREKGFAECGVPDPLIRRT